MKRLARISTTGSIVAIITGDEQAYCKQVEGKLQYPVTFFGEPDYIPVIVQNFSQFENNIGLKFNDLEDWAI